jgi:hypothetical protein
MGESKRQPKADEAALIDICQSADSVQGDMPVYDLRSVFNPTLYPRKYPDKVVGTGGAAWFELMDLLDNDVEVARFRRAGINTLAFTILYDLDDSGVPVIKRSKEAANLIIRAKIRGFAVFVNLDTFTNQIPCSGSYEDNRASWHDIERRAAVALATFAQQLNVEYISPDNESESGLQGDCLDPLYSQTSGRDPYQQMLDPLGEEGFTARVGVMSAWHVELLPALREIFDGKIIAHFGNSHPKIYVPEYDGLTFTLDHGHLSAEQFRAHVRTDYLSADSAARESGDIQWMTWAYLPFSLEADFNDPEHPDYDPNYQPDPVEDQRMLEMQQVYIQASVDELPDLRGDILQGWLDKGLEIRGSEAEVILSNTFGTS